MKKLLATLVSIFVLYVIYYDLTEGTLSNPTSIVLLPGHSENPSPTSDQEIIGEETNSEAIPATDQGLHFQEVEVAAGSTVLSIVEQIQDGPLPVSIPQLVEDFETLNPSTKPESIQIGKVYKFPIYPSTASE